jgi:hypothetical protein
MSVMTGLVVSTEVPKSPCSTPFKIELLVIGQVEAHLFAHAGDDMRGRTVTDDSKHRINRHYTADKERYGQKAEIGRDDDDQKAGYRRGKGR